MPRLDVDFQEGKRDAVSVSMTQDTIEALFDKCFEGWCPVCRNVLVDEDEIVCCGCVENIIWAHFEQHGENCSSQVIRTLTRAAIDRVQSLDSLERSKE